MKEITNTRVLNTPELVLTYLESFLWYLSKVENIELDQLYGEATTNQNYTLKSYGTQIYRDRMYQDDAPIGLADPNFRALEAKIYIKDKLQYKINFKKIVEIIQSGERNPKTLLLFKRTLSLSKTI